MNPDKNPIIQRTPHLQGNEPVYNLGEDPGTIGPEAPEHGPSEGPLLRPPHQASGSPDHEREEDDESVSEIGRILRQSP